MPLRRIVLREASRTKPGDPLTYTYSNMFKKLLFILLVLSPSFVVASELPFTDVPSGVPYYPDLKHMYDAGIIGDTVDHLFRPD